MEYSQHSASSAGLTSPASFETADDPVLSARRAEIAREKFLYSHTPGQTVFDRFTDIPAPGGIRMLRKIVDNYEASWYEHAKPG